MNGIAPHRASPKGRPWPSFFLRPLGLLAWGLCGSALAQEAIYRCGNEYTNAPRDKAVCEKLAEQAVTVIPGLRVQTPRQAVASSGPGAQAQRMPIEPSAADPVQPSEREAQARTILAQELERVEKQHQTWSQAYQQAKLSKSSGDAQANPNSPDRMAELKAAIERAERDKESLQRELARRPVSAQNSKP